MSRSTKSIAAASLLLAAIASGGWAWFLRARPQQMWEMWSSVLTGFAAFLAIPALAFALLALRSSRADEPVNPPEKDAIVRGDVRPGRDAYIADLQYFDRRDQPGGQATPGPSARPQQGATPTVDGEQPPVDPSPANDRGRW
jgi:hypothetical protein